MRLRVNADYIKFTFQILEPVFPGQPNRMWTDTPPFRNYSYPNFRDIFGSSKFMIASKNLKLFFLLL